MVTLTLDKMAGGGIYDQIGGGFHRYAVDAIWLVPHFEKMLYDNAQLARVYLDAYRRSATERYRQVATETLDFVAAGDDRARGRVLRHPGRRQRGRRGQVLRLDAGGDRRGARRQTTARSCVPTSA